MFERARASCGTMYPQDSTVVYTVETSNALVTIKDSQSHSVYRLSPQQCTILFATLDTLAEKTDTCISLSHLHPTCKLYLRSSNQNSIERLHYVS